MLVAPFFIWVGISRDRLPDGVFTALIVLGILLTLYHGYKAYNRLVAKSSYAWVNLVHVLWVGPLLLYAGIHKKETPRSAFELILLTGFAALGYHMYEMAAHYDFL